MRGTDVTSDFIHLPELSALTGFAPSTLRNSHQRKTGPLAGILCTLGNRRLGCWRADYLQFVAAHRKLKPAPEQQTAAA
jgi:hypothetical protein